MRKISFVMAAALLAIACSRQPTAAPPTVEEAATPHPLQLQFIEDDYERARSTAQQRNVPLFVDVWASWCHTCSSMKQYVLTDPLLAKLAGSFVWASIDSERKDNAAFLQKFPTRSLPTLWVIDPAKETPLLKWIGAATAPELKGVLDDALQDRAAQLALQPEAAGSAEVNTLWLRAQHASAAGEGEQAIGFYKRALESAPAGWERRPRAVEALSMRLAENDHDAEVVDLAVREAKALPTSTARLNVVLNAIDAAQKLPADAPQRAALPSLIEQGTALAETPTESILLDDRSSLYLTLIEAHKTANPGESQRLAKALSSALDAQAARETEPARRRVWDPHRVEAYLAIDEPSRAVPILEQSEKEAPEDYNAPARLARVYLTMRRIPEAKAAIERALPLASGPRKLRLYTTQADILVAADDKVAARAALLEAVAFGKQLPERYGKQVAGLQKKADELAVGQRGG